MKAHQIALIALAVLLGLTQASLLNKTENNGRELSWKSNSNSWNSWRSNSWSNNYSWNRNNWNYNNNWNNNYSWSNSGRDFDEDIDVVSDTVETTWRRMWTDIHDAASIVPRAHPMLDLIIKIYCTEEKGLGWWRSSYNYRRVSKGKCSFYQAVGRIDCDTIFDDEEPTCDCPPPVDGPMCEILPVTAVLSGQCLLPSDAGVFTTDFSFDDGNTDTQSTGPLDFTSEQTLVYEFLNASAFQSLTYTYNGTNQVIPIIPPTPAGLDITVTPTGVSTTIIGGANSTIEFDAPLTGEGQIDIVTVFDQPDPLQSASFSVYIFELSCDGEETQFISECISIPFAADTRDSFTATITSNNGVEGGVAGIGDGDGNALAAVSALNIGAAP